MKKTKNMKLVRGRLENNAPNPVDVHVGQRIHLRRMVLQITQQKLSEMLGLTFQQVQKYEKGTNRVSASRLWDISRILEIPMDFFFEEMDEKVAQKSPMMLNSKSEKIFEVQENHLLGMDPMKTAETMELVRAYYKIPNRKIARQMFNLLKDLSKSSAGFPCSEDEN